MTTWYKIDNTKLTNAEIRRLAPNALAFVIGWLIKLCRWRFRPRFGFPRSDRLDLVEYEDLPRGARRALREMLDDCEDLGFRITHCWTLECLGDMFGCGVTLLDPPGTTWAALIWTRGRIRASVTVDSGMAFCSKLEDGAYLSTTNLAKKIDTPPEFEAEYRSGASVAKLDARHRDRLRGEARRAVALDLAALKQVATEIRLRAADWNIARGVWVPMSDAEVATLRKQTPTFDDD